MATAPAAGARRTRELARSAPIARRAVAGHILAVTRGTAILVVDDDDDTRGSIAMVLRAEGYEVQGARNGREALDLLGADPLPDLILLDLMMPVMNGWHLLESIAASKRLARLPVLVFTAAGDRAAQPIDRPFLRKPVDLERLLEAVDRLCRPA
jgi:CheY-like chemotaxis protein